MNWATVALGPSWKMSMLHDVLEEQDIPSLVADSNMKTIDPFLAPPFSLDCQLQVPGELAERARSAIEELKEDALELTPDEPPRTTEEERGAAVEDIGRRIRWASVLAITSPFALLAAPRYLRSARRLARPPAQHRVTIAAIVFSCLFSGLTVAVVLWRALFG